MVTLSNLKQAEKDLDQTLKRRRKGQCTPANYWGTGDLGSGPHINLFEGAELEGQHHVAEHQKQIRYTERNNELAEKSKTRPFSEFDEIAGNIPWYMRTPSKTRAREAEADSEVATDSFTASASSSASSKFSPLAAVAAAAGAATVATGPRRKWSESHGQAVLQTRPSRQVKLEIENKLQDEDAVKSELAEHLADTKRPSSPGAGGCGVKLLRQWVRGG